MAPTHRHRAVSASLALLFAWCGIAYHWLHFSQLTPAAWIFGALFLFGSVAFAWTRIEFISGGPARIATAAAFIAYALVGYPLLGPAFGHRYPASPTFGAPCPVTIFAIALLISAKSPLRIVAAAAPLLWTAVASLAAFRFGVFEDLGLLAAAGAFLLLGIPWRGPRFAMSNQ